MSVERLHRTLVILLILAALTFLVEKALRVAMLFGNTILLFALAWLLSFTLSPAVAWLSGQQDERRVGGAEERGGEGTATPSRPVSRGALSLRAFAPLHKRLPRPLAVVVVYLGLLLALGLAGLWVAPVAAAQLYQLGLRLPEYVASLPDFMAYWQRELRLLGVEVDLADMLRSPGLIQRARDLGANLIQNLVSIAAGVANLLANLLIILVLSFYMTLDGPALARRAIELVPADWRDEAHLLGAVVDRTFGGFVRGQLIQAALFALGTVIVMSLAGLGFGLVASLLAGILMLIPLLGPLLALIPPLIIALFQAPGTAFWVLLALFVYEQIIINVLMPRLIGEMVGLHPLLVFAALLVGIRLAGVWGTLFGIPVAAALSSIALYFYLRVLRTGHLSGNVAPAASTGEAVQDSDRPLSSGAEGQGG